jgi:hypothetical protein
MIHVQTFTYQKKLETHLLYMICKYINSVGDPDTGYGIRGPGSDAFLTPGSGTRDLGWVKNESPDPG